MAEVPPLRSIDNATPMWDSRRVDLRDALTAMKPAFGELYVRAVDLLVESPSRARLALLGHCLRELVNNVAVEPIDGEEVVMPPRANVDGRTRLLAEQWELGLLPTTDDGPLPHADDKRGIDSTDEGRGQLPEAPELVPIPRGVYNAARDVVVEVRRGSTNARTRYSYLVAGTESQVDHSGVRTLKRLIDRCVNWAHLDRDKDVLLPAAEEVLALVLAVENALRARVLKFFETAADVRALIEEANRRAPSSGRGS